MSAGTPAQRSAEAGAGVSRADNLILRVLSALVLAPLAIAVALIGGWPFVAFWALAATGIVIEWHRMISAHREIRTLLAAIVALACAGAAVAGGYLGLATVLIIVGALIVAAIAHEGRRSWAAIGVLYGGAVLLGPTVLRSDGEFGFLALLFLFAVVWATDIFGYFGGRLVGGPRLWARISPKKTWAGAIGGAIGAVLAGCAVALASGLSNLLAVALLALLMSAVSQAGDLFESAVKRKFGVKDAGQVIPGHGGIMDRLDGFLAAAVAAALIGLLKGGFAGPARGFLVW